MTSDRTDLVAPSAIAESAQEYLDQVSDDARRNSGQVYTPGFLAREIVRRSGHAHSNVLDATFLDPACGGGAFLVVAAENIALRLTEEGFNLRTKVGHRKLLSTIQRNVWGVEVDGGARAVALSSLHGYVSSITGRSVDRASLASNVIACDFLSESASLRLRKKLGARPIDFVVGNPPYVSTDRIPVAYKRQVRAQFQAAHGRIDLYLLFIEQAIRLASPGSVVSFITPDKYLTSYSATRLRELLLRSAAIRDIACFTSHKIFAGVATVPCITTLEVGGKPGSFDVVTCEVVDQRIRETRSVCVSQNALTSSAWTLGGRSQNPVVRRARTVALSELCVRISAGPATGRDRIFSIDADSARLLEPELIRAVVRGRDVLPNEIRTNNLAILFPYSESKGGRLSPISLREFPRAAAYLRRHRRELSRRHCVQVWGKAWFEYHDSPYVDLSSLPKILVPDLAASNRFAFDCGHYFPLHSAYYIVLRDPRLGRALAAVLNTDFYAHLVRNNWPLAKDGFLRYRRQFLKDLPVPELDSDAVNRIERALIAQDYECINGLVCRLLGIKENDRRTIALR